MSKFRVNLTLVKCVSIVTTVLLLLSIIPFSIAYVVAVDTEAELKSAIGNNSTINLTADITLSSSWTPANYSGTINGNGHVITTSKNVFATLSGTANDLGVAATGTSSSNALLAITVSGTVDGCFAYGKITTTSTGVVGGLVGTLSTNGRVSESFSCVDITADSATYVGGLIGKIDGGTVSDCYSSGSISVARKDYNLCKIAGLANLVSGTATNTYTTCQLRQPNSRAKASGVNGLFDNQLSIVRESVSNQGLNTLDLIKSTALGEKYDVTGTSYPVLRCFYEEQWGDNVDDIVRVSTAAAAFSDKDSTKRFEPTDFVARADYLTRNTYIDRSNGHDMVWSLKSSYGKVYDTVPVTSPVSSVVSESGNDMNLLRAEFEFSANDAAAEMTVTSGGYKRTWYLTINDKNPYFYSGSGANNGMKSGDPFWISTVAQLNVVRHYCIIGSYHYKLYSHISCSDFDPIVDFKGNFFGNSKELRNIKLTNADGLTSVGVFANTLSGTIRYLTLTNPTVSAQPNTNPDMGCVVGTAHSTNIYRNIVSGSNTLMTNTGTTGGVVGKATGTSSHKIYDNLVTATMHVNSVAGGIAGEVSGAVNFFKNGSTGILIGTTNLGGLIGKTTSTKIENCYSTMAVISTATGEVNIGGLVGSNGGTLTKSYAASFVYAKDATRVGPLIGAGTVPTSSYYEGVGSTGGALPTTSMVGTSVMSNLKVTTNDEISADSNGDSWSWTKSSGYMPQITYFTRTSRYKTLSLISTTPVYYQQYWNEAYAENMTTGWITNSSSTVQYNSPSGISKDGTYIGNGAINTYAVSNGIGFEIGSSGDLVALSFVQTGGLGIRAAGAIRDGMHTISYDVTGVSGVNTYVEIGFAPSKTGDYKTYQVMTVSGSAEKILYDMPADQFVRLKVRVEDNYKVQSVTLNNGIAMTLQDGYYVSNSDLNADDIKITIKLAVATPPWGLHQQFY